MALAQLYSAVAGDTITAARWNNEFGNIYSNGTDVAFPVTKAVSFAGYTVTLDATGVTTISSTASAALVLDPGSKAGTPGINGTAVNVGASTFTDSNTAASGTAAQWHYLGVRKPTLAATNLNVTTTEASTVYIEDAPAAGTNETLTAAYALNVAAGKTNLGGAVHVGGNSDLSGTLTMNSKSIVPAKGAAVASVAGTTDIWAVTDGDTVHITGTNAITGFGTAPQAGARKVVIFDGALTLTHGANLVCPGAANITTAANDIAVVYADTTTKMYIQSYTKADGTNVISPTAAQGASLVLIETLDLSSDNVVNNLGSTYDVHIFELVNVKPGTNAVSFELTVSPDNGSTFANGVYEYSGTVASSAADSVFTLGVSLSNTAVNSLCGTVKVYTPQATSLRKDFQWSVLYKDSAGNIDSNYGGGHCGDNAPDVVTNAIDAIKFAMSAGTIAGTVYHYGIKKA